MLRTTLVELTRLRWRRAVLVLLAVAVVAPVVIAAVLAWQTRPLTDADLAAAEQRVQAEIDQPYNQRTLERCVQRPERYGGGGRLDTGNPAAVQAFCERSVLPRTEYYLDRQELDLRSVYRDAVGVAVITIVTMLLLLIGVTFAGHDWNTGSMSNQVLFEPRRWRIWLGKALAVMLVGIVTATVVLGLFWGILAVVAATRDLGPAEGVSGLIWAQSWRGVVLAVAAGVGGYAVTMLLRSTVAALGILFAVTVVAPILIAISGMPGNERALPQNNALAWLTGEARFQQFDDPACFGDLRTGPRPEDCVLIIDRGDAAWYFGGLLAVACAASVFSFSRRDVL